MLSRHLFLVVAGLGLGYSVLSTRGWQMLGFRDEAQISMGLIVGVSCLAAWTALEITGRVLAARAPRCVCGYSLAGLTCSECGRVVGEG